LKNKYLNEVFEGGDKDRWYCGNWNFIQTRARHWLMLLLLLLLLFTCVVVVLTYQLR